MKNKKINQMTTSELVDKKMDMELPHFNRKEWKTKAGLECKKEWYTDQTNSQYYREVMVELEQRVGAK